jgi:hypothetical protein
VAGPATGSFYSLLTFVALGGAFIGGTGWACGWAFPPPDSATRLQISVSVLYFVAAGFFAMMVGRHRDVTYLEALRRGAIDVGRKLKGLVQR